MSPGPAGQDELGGPGRGHGRGGGGGGGGEAVGGRTYGGRSSTDGGGGGGGGGGGSGGGGGGGVIAAAAPLPIATKREVEAVSPLSSSSLPDGRGGPGGAVSVAAAAPTSGADAAVAAMQAAANRRRKTGPSSRGVANLTPEQLAKKRANDREAQRAIRERTKNQIENLERRIQELTSLQPYQELQAVIRAKESVELENANIKRHLVSAINLLGPIVGLHIELPCIAPAQPYTPSPSVTAPASGSLPYHHAAGATPPSSASPAGGLDQHHHLPLPRPPPPPPPPPQSWPSGSSHSNAPNPQPLPYHSGGGSIDEHTRAQLEQQRLSLRHGLDMGQERLDLGFLLAQSQSQRVPRLRRGVDGAQDSPEYQHVPMKHDWTLVSHQDHSRHARPNHAWESPVPPTSAPGSGPSHHGHDSEASSPGYVRRDTPGHHGPSHGLSPGAGNGNGGDGGGGGGIHSGPADHDVHGDANSTARYAATRNCGPTCPLDHLLIDFLSERRQRAAEGYPPQEIAGPKYPSVSSLLNPARSAYSHPLSKFFTDILAKFPDISRLPEKVAVLYVMFLFMRWQIWPTRENYERLPEWIVPLPCQLVEPHPAWIDYLPFPRMRDRLVRHYNPAEYLFDNFFVPYTTTLTLSWPYEEVDTLLQSPDSDELMINPVFERHLRNLDNWKLGKAFADAFPGLADSCNLYTEGRAKSSSSSSTTATTTATTTG